jgi:hypothetical protein
VRPPANGQDIRRFLDLIAVSDAVFEIRALNVRGRGTVAGYFDDQHIDHAVEAAVSLSSKATGVYATLNPVDPRLQARAKNVRREKSLGFVVLRLTRRSFAVVAWRLPCGSVCKRRKNARPVICPNGLDDRFAPVINSATTKRGGKPHVENSNRHRS